MSSTSKSDGHIPTVSMWEETTAAGEHQAGVWQASEEPKLTEADIIQMRVRVIALENLLISLMATASDEQLGLARQMAQYIAPRSGFTPHKLTVSASSTMVDLVERAERFRNASQMH